MKITSIKRNGWVSVSGWVSFWSLIFCTFLNGGSVYFDELLEKTPYAQLLKELICMTDAIGLLHHRMDNDERKLIEDSILGKIVRISRLLSKVDNESPSIDLDYLNYWIGLAKSAKIPPLLADEIDLLEQKVQDHFDEVVDKTW